MEAEETVLVVEEKVLEVEDLISHKMAEEAVAMENIPNHQQVPY